MCIECFFRRWEGISGSEPSKRTWQEQENQGNAGSCKAGRGIKGVEGNLRQVSMGEVQETFQYVGAGGKYNSVWSDSM